MGVVTGDRGGEVTGGWGGFLIEQSRAEHCMHSLCAILHMIVSNISKLYLSR